VPEFDPEPVAALPPPHAARVTAVAATRAAEPIQRGAAPEVLRLRMRMAQFPFET
jgi:hypothetical protein